MKHVGFLPPYDEPIYFLLLVSVFNLLAFKVKCFSALRGVFFSVLESLLSSWSAALMS